MTTILDIMGLSVDSVSDSDSLSAMGIDSMQLVEVCRLQINCFCKMMSFYSFFKLQKLRHPNISCNALKRAVEYSFSCHPACPRRIARNIPKNAVL